MKGCLKTVSVSGHSSNTNFNDWSDPKYKLLPSHSVEKICLDGESSLHLPELKQECSDQSLKYSLELSEMRDKIREGYPLMSKKEIRNFRLPFYESLLLNLKEDGFLLTYEFIKDLIAVDDVFHKDMETRFSLRKRPILKLTKSVLIPLSDGLRKAETSKLNDDKTQEAKAFLDLATLFSNADDPSWYWIAQEIFEQCIEVVDNVDRPVDLQLKATSKYLYALFLFNELHNLIEAKSQIECSMSISEGKNWTIGNTKDKNRNTLYIESCILLHKIFLEMAQHEMIGHNTEEAIQLCRNSLLWAKVINSKSAEGVALQKLINIYLSVNQLYSVPELLESYLKLYTELGNFEGLCEGYILGARYHIRVGEKENVIEDMKQLLTIAKENNITNMVATAHHKLATYCLQRGADTELLEHAIEAYMSYLNLRVYGTEIEEARCLVGVAQGQEIMSDYCNLVVEADNWNLIERLILYRWKALRIPFFDRKLVFIPEIDANTDLSNKAEDKKNEEFLAHIEREKSELTSMTSRMPSIVRSLQKSTSTSSTNRERLTIKELSFHPSILYKSKSQNSITTADKNTEDDRSKRRTTIRFSQAHRSVSGIMGNE